MKKLIFGLTIMLSISTFASSDVVLPVENASNLNNFVFENSNTTSEAECVTEAEFTSCLRYRTRDCYYAFGVQIYCTDWVYHDTPDGGGPIDMYGNGSV